MKTKKGLIPQFDNHSCNYWFSYPKEKSNPRDLWNIYFCILKIFLKYFIILKFIFYIILMCWCQKLFLKNKKKYYFNVFTSKKHFIK